MLAADSDIDNAAQMLGMQKEILQSKMNHYNIKL